VFRIRNRHDGSAQNARTHNVRLRPTRPLNSAIDTAHGVQQKDEKSPERNEFKSPFSELIVAARRMMAARADCAIGQSAADELKFSEDR
jgi:hypothetical protein